MDNIKVEQDINNQYPYNYIFTYSEICKVCINIKYLFELNLLVLLNRTNWFIYYNNSNINKKDIDNLFHINKKGIFTCNLFNESMNDHKIVLLDSRDNILLEINSFEIEKFIFKPEFEDGSYGIKHFKANNIHIELKSNFNNKSIFLKKNLVKTGQHK